MNDPFFQAVCCEDHTHCCPENTKCDVSSGKCIRGDTHIDWFTKTEAVSTKVQPSVLVPPNPVKCDDSHECPTANTCCKLDSGDWGCCPVPNVSIFHFTEVRGCNIFGFSWSVCASFVKINLSRVVRKPAFCICENIDADQLGGNREADQRLCFRYTDTTIPLLSKSEISSL